MTTDFQRRYAVQDVVASVAYILDAREYDRLGQVFHWDIDFVNPGRLEARGLDSIIASFKSITDPARSHSNTNIVVSLEGDSRARSVCKAVTLRADGVIAVAEYRDLLVLTGDGWRIIERRIQPL